MTQAGGEHAQEEPLMCGECGGADLIHDYETGETVCRVCGIVIAKVLNRRPEWRTFDPDQHMTRPRAELHSHPMIPGTSTRIGWETRDVHGGKFTAETKTNLHRMRRLDTKLKFGVGFNRSLMKGLQAIKALSFKLNLPSIVEQTAANLYFKALKADYIRGRSIELVAASSVYLACRIRRIIRNVDEIVAAATLQHKDFSEAREHKKLIRRNYRQMREDLEIKVALIDPRDQASKVINQMELSSEVEHLTMRLIERLRAMRLTVGKSSSGVAVAAIYIALRILGKVRGSMRGPDVSFISQNEIAHAASTTAITLRNVYKFFMRNTMIECQV